MTPNPRPMPAINKSKTGRRATAQLGWIGAPRAQKRAYTDRKKMNWIANAISWDATTETGTTIRGK